MLVISNTFNNYANRLAQILTVYDWSSVELLADAILKNWTEKRQVFLCGNGGSAANAIHIANDFVYGVAMKSGEGIRAISLSANQAVVTCISNDLGYERVFAEQLAVQANEGDILIVLSGSGNSKNIILAVEQAQKMKLKTYAILGYAGGKCKEIADVSIHFPIDDMQIAEDLQLIVGHMLMQRLYQLHKQKIKG
jgi:D-sedoheptulose 7-phosphate isomerase